MSRAKDLEVIRRHWEDESTVSLKDLCLRELERKAIMDRLARYRPASVLDIGCGDCSDTVYYTQYADRVLACDYSETMLKRAGQHRAGAQQERRLP